jgi:hypothetical protein
LQSAANTPELIKNALECHRRHPDVSLQSHFRAKVLATADRLLPRKLIYLDTRYWITLRDVQLGRPRTSVDGELLTTLTNLVKAGKVICPINANLFAELLKQRDDKTRVATAQLIDELSLGVALQPEEERIGTEIHHCALLNQRDADALEPLNRLVWTSVSYVLGFTNPEMDALTPAEKLACDKAFMDYFWGLPFADQISTLGPAPEYLNTRWDLIAERINTETKKHGKNPGSFKELHLHEFVGYLEGYLPTMTRIVQDMATQAAGIAPSSVETAASEEGGKTLLRILSETFRQDKLGKQLPTVVIKSALYAAVRWNMKRQFTGNDLHDFGHASAALPYFDYFATDKGLKHLITNELKYDQKYDVVVMSEPRDFLSRMKEI